MNKVILLLGIFVSLFTVLTTWTAVLFSLSSSNFTNSEKQDDGDEYVAPSPQLSQRQCILLFNPYRQRSTIEMGPLAWSQVSNVTKNEFIQWYKNTCHLNDNANKLVVVGNFNDDRKPKESMMSNYLRPYVNYDIENNQLEWDINGINYGLNQLATNDSFDCGHWGYPNSCRQFKDLFSKYPTIVENKHVLICGSVTPWIEIILLHFGAFVTVSDFNLPKLKNSKNSKNSKINLNFIHVNDISKYHHQFDVIVSFSSIEHDGLGRYGDPINPKGDFASIVEFYNLLKCQTDSYLFIATALAARDYTIWNSHRFYSKCRWNALFMYNTHKLFQPIDSFGSTDAERFSGVTGIVNQTLFVGYKGNHQPLVIMKKMQI